MRVKSFAASQYVPPNLRVSFEHKIRKAYVWVEAEAWGDSEGIYKTQIVNVWIDGAEVYDLLTDDDLVDIDAAIIPAISTQHSEDIAMKGY